MGSLVRVAGGARATFLILLMLLPQVGPGLWSLRGHRAPGRTPVPVVDWAHYHDYEELTDLLQSLEQSCPGLVELEVIGRTWLGRDIWAIIITDESTGPAGKTGIFVVGYHHARERITIEVPLYIAWRLVAEAAHNETVASLLERAVFYIVPALNADGIEVSEINPWQRKNLRPVDEDGDGLVDEDPPEDVDGDGTIYEWWNDTGWGLEGIDNDGDGLVNEDWLGGVDLNRNYGFHWNDTSVDSGSSDPSDEDYIGPAPFSEPETRALRDFVLNHTDIELAVSYHSGAACVLYPWSYTHEPCPDEARLSELARIYGEAAGYPYRRGEVPVAYTCSGEWGDWMYAVAGALPLTIEVYGMYGNWTWWEEHTEEVNGTYYFKGIWEYFNPPEEEIEAICARNYQALLSVVLSYLPPSGGGGEAPPSPPSLPEGPYKAPFEPTALALAVMAVLILGIALLVVRLRER
ncbi:hypothetical protein DRO33_03495 [Candidatus Bathyarchaeota archaeon]|nr:MAG: hypothetical protein DRO33_03495 [Candidatus Bathyarchaeota archaeon]